MEIIKNNADFLFIYEAINCNPNGDPDQENKPRMDYDTHTNLVTDTRLKRYLRDYFMQKGYDVFVSMEEKTKVKPDTKFVSVVERMLSNPESVKTFFESNEEMAKAFDEVLIEKKDKAGVFKSLQSAANKKLNFFILDKLVKDTFIDIRLFGSAFAVKEFTQAYTGPVQINWGYSLNKVYPVESNSIVTIMWDDSSTFGKDHRIHYSLLSFHGTMNAPAAKYTGLTLDDVEKFRDAVWNAIPSLPTRSKMNQYPKLYLEIIYQDGYHNGHFGDLRNYIRCTPTAEVGDFKKVRKHGDLHLDFSGLEKLISENMGTVIKEIKLEKSNDLVLNL